MRCPVAFEATRAWPYAPRRRIELFDWYPFPRGAGRACEAPRVQGDGSCISMGVPCAGGIKCLSEVQRKMADVAVID